MFIIYNVIYRRKAVLRFGPFVKTKLWTKTEEMIRSFTYSKLIVATKRIKETNRYTNPTILAHE